MTGGLIGGLVERAFDALANRLIPAVTVTTDTAPPAAAEPAPAVATPTPNPAPAAARPPQPTTTSTSPWTNLPAETPDVPFAVYIGLARR